MQATQTPLLKIENLSLSKEDKLILNGIELAMHQPQCVAVVGITGAGKSTLLKCIAGLEQPSEGRIYFQDKQVLGPDYKLIPGHPNIAYLSQFFELRNHYRVDEMVAYYNKVDENRKAMILDSCKVTPFLTSYHTHLSGGEQQRLAIALKLLSNPQLLILDEPFTQLDLYSKQELKTILKELIHQFNIPILLTSHDALDVLPWADEIWVMHDGRIAQTGSARDVYFNPANLHVAGLLGDYALLSRNVFADLSENYIIINDKVFVRPNQVVLSQSPTETRGEIQQLEFLGALVKTSILLDNGEMVIALTNAYSELSIGQKVNIKFLIK